MMVGMAVMEVVLHLEIEIMKAGAVCQIQLREFSCRVNANRRRMAACFVASESCCWAQLRAFRCRLLRCGQRLQVNLSRWWT
jgi:hypothetical protein